MENILADTTDGYDRIEKFIEDGSLPCLTESDPVAVKELEDEPAPDTNTTTESDLGSHKSQIREQEPTDSRQTPGRYSLRGRVRPPVRLC